MTLKKKVKVEQTGDVFDSVKDAAAHFGVTESAIYKRLKGTRGISPLSLTFSLIEPGDG